MKAIPNKTKIIGLSLLAVLFLALAFHHPIEELIIKINDKNWYQDQATLIESHVEEVKTEGQSQPIKYRIYAHYQYKSMGTTYESHSISKFGKYLTTNSKNEAYEAINSYLKAGSLIEVNISKNPPKRSYLFRNKLPSSNNQLEIIMLVFALLAVYALNITLKQLRNLSQKDIKAKHSKHFGQPIS